MNNVGAECQRYTIKEGVREGIILRLAHSAFSTFLTLTKTFEQRKTVFVTVFTL